MSIRPITVANFVMIIAQMLFAMIILQIGFGVWGVLVTEIPLWRYIVGLLFLYLHVVLIINFKFDWSK